MINDPAFEFFRDYTIPAVIRNKFAPSWGFDQFRDVDEYLLFVDELFERRGKGRELLEKIIANYYKENYEWYLYHLDMGNSVDRALEILNLQSAWQDLKDYLMELYKEGKLDPYIEKYFERLYIEDPSFQEWCEEIRREEQEGELINYTIGRRRRRKMG